MTSQCVGRRACEPAMSDEAEPARNLRCAQNCQNYGCIEQL